MTAVRTIETDPGAGAQRARQVCRVEVVREPAQWAALGPVWNDLLARSGAGTVFLSWEWLSAWIDRFLGPDRRLMVLLVFRGPDLIGAAPWCVRTFRFGGLPVRQVEFLGAPEGGSDHLDVPAAAREEAEVAGAIVEYLYGAGGDGWDTLRLRDVPANSIFLLHFLSRLGTEGKYVAIDTSAFCPRVPLPASTDELHAGLSANRRQQLARHRRGLERSARVEHVTLRDELETSGLARFFELCRRTDRQERAERLAPFLHRFAHYARHRGYVEVDLLRLDGTDVAGLVHLRYEGGLSMYSMAVDRQAAPRLSVGTVLMGLTLERAVRERLRFCDLLKGAEPYKFHWAREGRRSLEVAVYRRHLGALVAACRFAGAIAKVLVR